MQNFRNLLTSEEDQGRGAFLPSRVLLSALERPWEILDRPRLEHLIAGC